MLLHLSDANIFLFIIFLNALLLLSFGVSVSSVLLDIVVEDYCIRRQIDISFGIFASTNRMKSNRARSFFFYYYKLSSYRLFCFIAQIELTVFVMQMIIILVMVHVLDNKKIIITVK